jgi:hypothetical protein
MMKSSFFSPGTFFVVEKCSFQRVSCGGRSSNAVGFVRRLLMASIWNQVKNILKLWDSNLVEYNRVIRLSINLCLLDSKI